MVGAHRLLLRQAQGDRSSLHPPGETRLAEGAEGDQGVGGPAGVEGGLQFVVVEAPPGAYRGPPDVVTEHLPVAVDVDLEHHRRTLLPRQQAGIPFGEGGRMERHVLVGAVHGDPPPARLRVDDPLGRDERLQVGDGVAEPDAAAGQRLEGQRLIEVSRPGRVDGHEGHVEEVAAGVGIDGNRGRRLEHLGRKLEGDPGLAADLGEDVGELTGTDTAAHGLCKLAGAGWLTLQGPDQPGERLLVVGGPVVAGVAPGERAPVPVLTG